MNEKIAESYYVLLTINFDIDEEIVNDVIQKNQNSLNIKNIELNYLYI